jgi:hypothetical protein
MNDGSLILSENVETRPSDVDLRVSIESKDCPAQMKE